MAGYPPPPYPPPPGPPYGSGPQDLRYQRRMMREQARAQRDYFRMQRDAYKQQFRGLRRGSIVGPLLVIAIGVIFLLIQTGKVANIVFWNFFGHWWPVILIGVGIVVLIEWTFDQLFRDETKPYVRRGIGGGVVFLLIIIAITGVVFEGIHDSGHTLFGNNFNFNENDFSEFMGDKHQSDQTFAQAFPAGSSLEVDNPRGDVTISGTSDDNQIHVIAHKEVYTRSDSDAATKAQQLDPSFSTSAMGLGSTVQLRIAPIENSRVDLIITVPAASGQTVTANHGDLHISNIKGTVNMTANHGDMEVSAITGPVIAHIQNSKSSFTAHSITGPLSLDGKGDDVTIAEIEGSVSMQGDFFGDTHLEHIRGTFKFHSSRTDFQLARLDGEASFGDDDLSADQALGPVLLSTRNRNITLDRITGDVTVTNRNGKIDITSAPPTGNISIENRSGEVNLTLPDQAAFHVNAETTDADIENDFSFPVSEQGSHKSVSGTVGKGTSNIKISNTQDNISIKRASIAPLAPLPPPPPPFTSIPPEAREAIAEAKKTVAEARKSAQEATKEARDATREAAKEAREAAKEAHDSNQP